MGLKKFTITVLLVFVAIGLIAQEEHLIAHWKLDEQSGNTIKDNSMNGFDGTKYSSAYAEGRINNSLLFNGTGAAIIPENNMEPSQIIGDLEYGTVMLWFTFRDFDGEMLPLFYFGETDTANEQNSLIIEIGHGNETNKKLYFTIINASFCFDSGENLDSNTWYHFAGVVSENGNTGYLNGVEMKDRHYNLGSDSSYTNFFSSVTARKMLALGYGRYGRHNDFWHHQGKIDDVRIYSKALSSKEIMDIYTGETVLHSYSINTDKLHLWPNPANTELFISIPQSNLSTNKGNIYSSDGTLVRQFDLDKNALQQSVNIDNLQPGMYILQVGQLKSVVVKR